MAYGIDGAVCAGIPTGMLPFHVTLTSECLLSFVLRWNAALRSAFGSLGLTIYVAVVLSCKDNTLNVRINLLINLLSCTVRARDGLAGSRRCILEM